MIDLPKLDTREAVTRYIEFGSPATMPFNMVCSYLAECVRLRQAFDDETLVDAAIDSSGADGGASMCAVSDYWESLACAMRDEGRRQ